jgi:hypothetical protein
MRRATITFAIACAAALAAAAPAGASTIILGSPLADPDSFTLTSCESEGCIVTQLSLPGATIAAPQTGTITRWRALGDGSMRLIALHQGAGGTYQEVGSSAPVSGDGLAIHEYTASLPIQAGDVLALAFAARSLVPRPGFRPSSLAGLGFWPKTTSLLTPTVPYGVGAFELPLQADLTVPDPSPPSPPSPGTGDTSNPGPTTGSTSSSSSNVPAPGAQAPTVGPLTPPPSILALSLTNRRLTLGSRKGKPRRSASGGTTTLRYQLTAPADLAVDVQRQQCRKRNRKTRCSGFKTVATLQQRASTETGQLDLSTRVGGTTLGAGRYQLSVTATNSAGRSDPRTVSLSVARAK